MLSTFKIRQLPASILFKTFITLLELQMKMATVVPQQSWSRAVIRKNKRSTCYAKSHVSASIRNTAASAAVVALPRQVYTFVQKHFLPVGLASAALLGYCFPKPFLSLSEVGFVRKAIIAVFFLSGLNLRWADIADALSAPVALIYGTLSILLISPLLGIVFAKSMPYLLPQLKAGLTVFACVPTTLSSGAALAQQAGGNAALSVLLLVQTNLLGVLTMPTIIPRVFATEGSLSLSPVAFLLDLCQTVLLPLCLGRTLSMLSSSISQFAAANKPNFSTFSSACIITTVGVQMSKAAGKLEGNVSLFSLIWLAIAAVALHVMLLLLNMGACSILQIGGADDSARQRALRRTVIILSSQKTLPVCVSVVDVLAPSINVPPGLLVLPCVLGHLLQNIIDATLVSKWRANDTVHGRAVV